MEFENFLVFFNIQFQVSGELSAASPERLSMASPGDGGKRVHNIRYSSELNQSRNIFSLDTLHPFSFTIYIHCFAFFFCGYLIVV